MIILMMFLFNLGYIYIEVACWMHTGERQTGKMRMAYLRSMLNQDITLFDTEASTGEVISAISSEILVVQDALSEKVPLVILINALIFLCLMHYYNRQKVEKIF